ncbi:MAG: hypothetical protein U0L99_10760, partial [Ruminococcus sp.]|nr:hypothetical protein [Ruminococcus sp.]
MANKKGFPHACAGSPCFRLKYPGRYCLELVFIGNICGFSSKFFCRQGKNLQAYFRMARIFNAVCN